MDSRSKSCLNLSGVTLLLSHSCVVEMKVYIYITDMLLVAGNKCTQLSVCRHIRSGVK